MISGGSPRREWKDGGADAREQNRWLGDQA